MRYITGLALACFALSGADLFLPNDHLVDSVEKEVRRMLPTAAEKRFDEIGWAPDTHTALTAAAKANRPMYLFTYDGNIANGRC
jgi:hypothetical protein